MKTFNSTTKIMILVLSLLVVALFCYHKINTGTSEGSDHQSNTTKTPDELVLDANDDIHTYLIKLVNTFTNLQEDNFQDRIIISSKIEQFASMINQETQLAPGNISIKEFDKLTADAREFWKILIDDVTIFENNLTLEEINQITDVNIDSRFRLTKKLCTRNTSCDGCTLSEFDKLFSDNPSLDQNRFILVALMNSIKEDKFKPLYLPKLLQISIKKNASKNVTSYYQFAIKAIDRQALVKYWNESYLNYTKQLQLYEPERSLKETEDYASNILRSSPNCAHMTTISMEFARKRR